MCSDRPTRRLTIARRARHGQSLVELALLMPLFALILIGALDLSRVFIAYTRLTNVVHEGALYGSHYPTDTITIRSRAYGEANGQLGTPGTDLIINTTTDIRCYQGLTTTPIVALTPGDCTAQDSISNPIVKPGDSIEVTAHYVFRPLTAQLIRILPANYQVKKSMRMMIQ